MNQIVLNFVLLFCITIAGFSRDIDIVDKLFNRNANIMLLINPQDGSIEKVNQKAIDYYGYTKQKLLSLKIQDINTLTEKQIRKEMENVYLNKRDDFLFFHRLKNGLIKKVEVHAFPIVYDNKSLIFSVIHEIEDNLTQKEFDNRLKEQIELQTDIIKKSKENEKKIFLAILIFLLIVIFLLITLLQQQTRLQKRNKFKDDFLKVVFDSEPNITLTTFGQKIDTVNKAFIDFFEIEALEDFTKYYDCICDKFIEKDGYLSKYIQNEIWVNYIINNSNKIHKALIKKDGQLHEFIVKATNIEFDTHHRTLVVLIDVTLLNQQQSIILKQEKRALMGDMIENIAHQWRQPLSVILVSATGMKIKYEIKDLTDEEFIGYCNTIEHSVDYLSNTIEDFRNFYKQKNNETFFSVDNIIDDTLKIFDSKFKNRNIEVIQSVSSIKLQGNKSEFVQVVMNILSNAKDELEKINGRRLIFIDSIQKNNKQIINILDNAGGVPEEIIDKIFDSHFTTKGELNGTGVGLYMSKQIIEEHFKGSLNIENTIYCHEGEQYVGAKFSIVIDIKSSNETI